MATKKTVIPNVDVPAIKVKEFDLAIIGDSPLISHAWSEKAKLMMLQKQQKKASAGKEVRNPMREYAHSLYWVSGKPDIDNMDDEAIWQATQEGTFGFPVLAFKAAAIDAGYQQGAIDKKTTARGAFHIDGEFAVIEGKPSMREDMARIGMGVADLRYRAEFKEWSTVLHIRYNENSMSLEQICNLFNLGGFSCGVGDWRPAKDGKYGTFHIGG